MDEFTLIKRFFAGAGAQRAEVRLGIGDDAALIEPPDGQVAAIATDTVIAGVHFPADMDAGAIGHRALAVNLSDLAAMGATPAYALIALSVPAAEATWLGAFADGLGALARAHRVAVVGGDTTRSEVLTVTVTVIGWLPATQSPMTRAGAEAGHLIAVSGTPGDAAAGLACFGERAASTAHEALRRRFAYPTPRVSSGEALRGVASAAIDLSDGLLADAAKLAQASAVHLAIDARRLPLSAGLQACHGRDEGEQLALTGGDDYELLITLPANRECMLQAIARRTSCALTVVGEVLPLRAGVREAGASAWREGECLPLSAAGYRHFTS